jgi:hypothetical protein
MTAAAVDACRTLSSATSRLQSDRNIRTVGFVSAAVLGAATLSTFFLWPARPKQSIAVAPIVGSSYGVLISGGF